MYVVTKSNTYQGAKLTPGDTLDVARISESVVRVLIRQGLVRDVTASEAAEIRADYLAKKAAAERRFIANALRSRSDELTELDRLIAKQAMQMQATKNRAATVRKQIAEYQDKLGEVLLDAKPQGKAAETAAAPPPVESNEESNADLERRLSAMSARRLRVYARNALEADWRDLPQSKSDLIAHIMEARKG